MLKQLFVFLGCPLIIPHKIKPLLATLAALTLFCAGAAPAYALPSFARQTGQECSSCHVGGFGPQLTPYGKHFKLAGYTETDGVGTKIPLSGMFVTNFTHTATDQPDGAGPHASPNDNLRMQEASVFAAGRIAANLGMFAQLTYSGTDHQVALDNVDIRYARETNVGDSVAIFGVTLNNNPTVQDVWNSTPAWSFPYTGADLSPGFIADTLIAGGLEHQVYGMSAYIYWNDSLYAEIGGYKSLAAGTLSALGLEDDAGRISGIAPYWRLAYSKQLTNQSFSLGLFGLHAALDPDRSGGPTNKYTDYGIDATYQYLGSGKNVYSVNGSYIHEHQSLDFNFATEGSANTSNNLNTLKGDISYYYDMTYGVTFGAFNIWGSSDNLLYGEEDIAGSRTGAPNTTGFIFQLDWTPFGKADSWARPYANVKVGARYTAYTRFNGAKDNYDGAGRNASGNNTILLFIWGSI